MADKRILTTHAGSLPRPARHVELYATRAKGEEIDEAELIREGEAATRWCNGREGAKEAVARKNHEGGSARAVARPVD